MIASHLWNSFIFASIFSLLLAWLHVALLQYTHTSDTVTYAVPYPSHISVPLLLLFFGFYSIHSVEWALVSPLQQFCSAEIPIFFQLFFFCLNLVEHPRLPDRIGRRCTSRESVQAIYAKTPRKTNRRKRITVKMVGLVSNNERVAGSGRHHSQHC